MAQIHPQPIHPTPSTVTAPPAPIPPYTDAEKQEKALRFVMSLGAALLVRQGGIKVEDEAMAFLRQTTKPVASPDAPPITVFEAFGGGGVLAAGVDAAIVAAGGRPHHLAVAEWLDAPAAAYAHNIGQQIRRYRDVWCIADGELGSDTLTSAEKEMLRLARRKAARGDDAVDLLIGGPPCQPFSKARKKLKPEDGPKILPQVRLYGRMVRLAQTLRPRVVVIENVERCRRHPWVRRYLQSLSDSGYILSSRVVSAAEVGTCQDRERYLVVGVRSDLGPAFDFGGMLSAFGTRPHGSIEALWDLAEDQSKPDTLGRHIDGDGDLARRAAWSEVRQLLSPLPADLLNDSLRRNNGRPYGETYQRMRPDLPARPLTRNWGSPAHGAFLHPVQNRGLSRREAMRLQGLPDFYTLPDGLTRDEAALVIANGAPPQFALAVVGQVFRQGILSTSPTAFKDISAILADGLAARGRGAPCVVDLAAAASRDGDRVDEADIRRMARGQRMGGFVGLCRVMAACGYEVAWCDPSTEAVAGDREALAEQVAAVIGGRCRCEADVVRLAADAGVDRDVVAGWCGRTTKPLTGPRRPLSLAERAHRFRTLSAVGRALGVGLVVRPVMAAADRAEARRRAVEAIAGWKPLAATTLARSGSAA